MKETKIVIEIDRDGQISAEADGFTGDACLRDLDRLLDGLSAGVAEVTRKKDEKAARVRGRRVQKLGRKS